MFLYVRKIQGKLRRSFRDLKCIEHGISVIKQKQCIFEEINHPSMFQAPQDVDSGSRIIASWLHVLIRSNVAVAVGRNLFRLWSQRKIVEIKGGCWFHFPATFSQKSCIRIVLLSSLSWILFSHSLVHAQISITVKSAFPETQKSWTAGISLQTERAVKKSDPFINGMKIRSGYIIEF